MKLLKSILTGLFFALVLIWAVRILWKLFELLALIPPGFYVIGLFLIFWAACAYVAWQVQP